MPMFSNYNHPDPENPWIVIFDGYDPQDEGHREAVCALGNGYFLTLPSLKAWGFFIHRPNLLMQDFSNMSSGRIS
jgi:hypothetical protein